LSEASGAGPIKRIKGGFQESAERIFGARGV